MVPCFLIGLVCIRLIAIYTMALVSGIITSSNLTHIGLHVRIVIWSTLRLGCYKSIIRSLVRGLIPRPIRCVVLSVRWFVRWFIRRSMRGSINWTMRWSMGRYMSY